MPNIVICQLNCFYRRIGFIYGSYHFKANLSVLDVFKTS